MRFSGDEKGVPLNLQSDSVPLQREVPRIRCVHSKPWVLTETRESYQACGSSHATS